MGKLLEQRNRALDDINAGQTVKKIRDLESRVRELEEENARLKKVTHVSLPTNTMEQWVASEIRKATSRIKEQLAAEQLNNKLLREALEAVIKVHGYESGIPVEALAQPSDTFVLDAYVAEKVKEYQERLADALAILGADSQIEAEVVMLNYKKQVSTLTKQRDLAVEALKEMLEYAGIIEERCDSVATDKARAAIKESEEKR